MGGIDVMMTYHPPDEPEKLSARQQEVLNLLASGRSTESVAQLLHISPATVRNHVQQTLERLGAHSRLEAVALNRKFRSQPAVRLLRWCEREGIALQPWQQEMIKAAFGRRPTANPPVIPKQRAPQPEHSVIMNTAREQWGRQE